MGFQVEQDFHHDSHDEAAGDIDDQRAPGESLAEQSCGCQADAIATERAGGAAEGDEEDVTHEWFPMMPR